MPELDLDDLFAQDLSNLLDPSFPGPIQPLRIDNGVPVYSSEQISLYGLPDLWGIHEYEVVESRETSHPMVTDYQMEQERRGALRPIHHYNRVERFESILYQLIAVRGVVPRLVMDTIRVQGYDSDPSKIWNSIRSILKARGWRLYYNRIPVILDKLGYHLRINFNDQHAFILMIVNEFRKISAKFEEIKDRLERSYFPCLRYIAFKLLKEHGAVFEYDIPFLRTPRKEKMMDELWELLKPEVS